jgi:hypothetical protein
MYVQKLACPANVLHKQQKLDDQRKQLYHMNHANEQP